MNYRYILFALIAVLLISPVAAAGLNISIISYQQGVTMGDLEAFRSTVTSVYDYSVADGNTLDNFGFEPHAEGTYRFYLNHNDGKQESVLISFVGTSPATGDCTIAIDGGTSKTFFYPKSPITLPGTPAGRPLIRPIAFQIGVDTSTKTEYLIVSDKIDLPANNGVSFDSTGEAYIALPELLSINPIKSFSVYSINQFTVTGEALSIKNYAIAEQQALETACTGPLCGLGLDGINKIITAITDAIAAIVAFFGTVASMTSIMVLSATFFLGGQLFIGLNVFYIAIAIVMSIEDSDDLFQAFGKFYRMMMKLWRFYMELFKDLKEIFKWW